LADSINHSNIINQSINRVLLPKTQVRVTAHLADVRGISINRKEGIESTWHFKYNNNRHLYQMHEGLTKASNQHGNSTCELWPISKQQ
jgi:hypothetical protein